MFLYACVMCEALYQRVLILNTQDMFEKRHIVYVSNRKTVEEKKMLKALDSQKEVSAKLTKGLLDLIILQLINTQPMHGYQIITKIRKNFGVYFGPSTVYPLLNMLEKKGFVKSEWNMNSDRPRKIYSLTSNGQSMLNFTEDSLSLICKKMGTQINTQAIAKSVSSEETLIERKTISSPTDHLSMQIH
jgi:PadR family transcriptional regulator PadR